MKRIITLMVSVGIGVGLLQYNPAMQWIANMLARNTMDQYTLQAAQLSSEQQRKLLAAADDYNTRLAKGWIQKSDEVTDTEYAEALAIPGIDTIALVRIPAIAVNLPIYRGTSDYVLGKGVGHLYGSSLPVGGTGTHAVLSAHSGQTDAEFFTDLNRLEIGDTFQIEVLSRVLNYEVDDIQIVVPEDINNIGIDPDADYVTLLTCTPIHVNTHRLLVRGHRLPELAATGDAASKVSFWEFPGVPWWALIWLGSVSVAGMTGRTINRRRATDDDEPELAVEGPGESAVLPYQWALICGTQPSPRAFGSRKARRLALALAAAGFLVAAPLSSPAEASPALPSPDALGQIIVTKHVQTAPVTRDGTRQPATGQAVAGVQFAAAPVLDATGRPYDLATVTGWQAAERLTLASATNLGQVRYATTDAQGVATFRDLPIGVYRVWETTSPPASGTGLARPALVAVPMPNPATTGSGLAQGAWLYEVYLYPKNTPPDQPPGDEPPGDTPTEPPAELIPRLPETPSRPRVTTGSLGPALPPRLALTGSDARCLLIAGFLVVIGTLSLVGKERRPAPEQARWTP